MPRSLLSSRYKFGCLKAKNKMSISRSKAETKASKCSRIWDPLRQGINTRSMMKTSKDFKFRPQSHQLSLLQSKDWLTSDLVPFTVRYELEKRHNLELMARYVVANGNSTECSSSSQEDSEEDFDGDFNKNEYFATNPRRINFDDLEFIKPKEQNATKQKRKKFGNEEKKRLVCDICKKSFEKRWTLSSHMLSHSGDKPFRCSYKTCTKQYADRSNLRAHQRSKMHHTWKIFCNQCTKPFSEQRYLNLHSLSACRKYLAGVSKKTNP